MITLTLRNDFHNTTCKIRMRPDQTVLTRSQMRRVRKTLCGMSDCQCGEIRGPQEDFSYSMPTLDSDVDGEFATIELFWD